MTREKFVSGYLEKLIKDKDINKYYTGIEDPKQKELFKEKLRDSLGKSYDVYAKDYFENKGIGNYASSFLRGTGLVSDLAGTYMFWALGGAGFGLKGVGLAEKSLADLIDSRYYAKHAKTDSLTEKVKDVGLELGEGAVERIAAYLPLGVGEVADFMRGKNKYDAKVTARALGYTKQNFLDSIKSEEKQPTIIPIDYFKHPAYSENEQVLSQAG